MKRNQTRLFATTCLLVAWAAAAGISQAAVSPGLTAVSGNGQGVLEGWRAQEPFKLQARDANGLPAANIDITWQITQGQGTLVGRDARTDANGVATAGFVATTLQAGFSFATQTVTASSPGYGSATFLVTTFISRQGSGSLPLAAMETPPQGNRAISGRAGSTVGGAIQVQVVATSGDQVGRGIPNIGLSTVDVSDLTAVPPAACAGTPLTNAQGFASCDLVLTGAPGRYAIAGWVGYFQYTPTISLTIEPGATCSFTLSPSSTAIPAAGGTGTFNVTTGSNCGWTAATSASWITITSGASVTGNGSVGFSAGANAGIARAGTITVGGQNFTVNQAASGSGGGLTITTGATLPAAVVNTPYSTAIAASGGRQPYSYSTVTALPAGLLLNSVTGLITGAVSATGTYSFTIRVADADGVSQTRTFALTVVTTPVGGTGPMITNTSFPNGTIGTPYSELLTSVGACGGLFAVPPVYTVVAGALPPGLSIQMSASGMSTIAGTPTTNGSYSFTLKVTDNCGKSGTAGLAIVIGTGGGPGPGTGQLSASPTLLQFTAPAGATTAPVQVINVSSNLSSTFTAQAQMIVGPALNWLSVAPSLATTPAIVSVMVNPSGLLPGTYTGYVQLAPFPTTPTTAPLNVPVTLTVQPKPEFTVAPQNLFFLYSIGLPPSGSQTLTVLSTGAQFDYDVSVTTEAGGPWLFVTPLAGSTPGVLTVSANPLGLASGSYKGNIRLLPKLAGAASVSIPVMLSIPQTGPVIGSVVNAASYLPGTIAPGEFVAIFGANMGPRDVTLAKLNIFGLLDTTVAGTRVLFDGLPAPLYYTSVGQVAAIVPYGVSGRVATRIEVEYQGVRSQAIEQRVADSAPGIFTLSTLGSGQAAAINQNGTINSAQAGAEPGSIVAIYMTGEGQTDPAGVDGKLMDGPLSAPLLPVSAKIGGKDAEVTYAGSAPLAVAGLMQVNVKLPDGLPVASQVPVVITVGRVSSQAGVTIYTR